jgi:hypothetical protein
MRLLVWICSAGVALAESPYYAGALAGVSTLSADARAVPPAVSLYRPENGALVGVLGGIHLREYLGVQGNYTWNRNRVTLTTSPGGGVFRDEQRQAAQHAVSADLLVYFRDRLSWARPYLSVGGAVVRFRGGCSGSEPGLRVAVGMDLRLRDGWALRYSFCEVMSANPIAAQLEPRGTRNLANFQNLFGFVRSF